MAIKVGINGFGRIGRNVLRAALGIDGHRFRRRQRPDRRDDARAPAQVRLGPRQPEVDDLGRRRQDLGRQRQASRCCRRRIRRSCRGRSSARTSCSSPPVSSRTARARRSTSRRARRRSSSPRRRRSRTSRSCSASTTRLRPEEAPHHLERLVHDELPGAARQGAARRFGIERGWMTTIHATRTTSSCSTCRTRTCGARAPRRCR